MSGLCCVGLICQMWCFRFVVLCRRTGLKISSLLLFFLLVLITNFNTDYFEPRNCRCSQVINRWSFNSFMTSNLVVLQFAILLHCNFKIDDCWKKFIIVTVLYFQLLLESFNLSQAIIHHLFLFNYIKFKPSHFHHSIFSCFHTLIIWLL